MNRNWYIKIFFSVLASHGVYAMAPLFTENELKYFWEYDLPLVQSFNRLADITLFRVEEAPTEDIPEGQIKLISAVLQHLFIEESKVPNYVKKAIKQEQKALVVNKGKILNKNTTLLPLGAVLRHLLCDQNDEGRFTAYVRDDQSSNPSFLMPHTLSYTAIKAKGWKPVHIKALDGVIVRNIEHNRTLRSLLKYKNFKAYFEKLIGPSYANNPTITDMKDKSLILVDALQRRALQSTMAFSIELELPTSELDITFPSEQGPKQRTFKIGALGTVVGITAAMTAPRWFGKEEVEKDDDQTPFLTRDTVTAQ